MEFRSRLLNKTRVTLNSEESGNKAVSAITVLLLILVIIVFIVPAINNTKSLIQENAELERKKEALEQTAQTYSTAANYMEDVSGYKDDIYNKIPTNPSSASFVGDLTYYATFNSLNLDTISLIKKENGVESYVMRFNGGYTDIANFFKTIKRSDRYIKITNVIVTTNDKFNSRSSELSLIINVEAFYNE